MTEGARPGEGAGVEPSREHEACGLPFDGAVTIWRRRHRPHEHLRGEDRHQFCCQCKQRWPCSTDRLLTALGALRAERDGLERERDQARAERDSVQAVLDKVAEIAAWRPKPGSLDAFVRLAQATISPRGRAASLVRSIRLLKERNVAQARSLEAQGAIIARVRGDLPGLNNEMALVDGVREAQQQVEAALVHAEEMSRSLDIAQEIARDHRQAAASAEAALVGLRGAVLAIADHPIQLDHGVTIERLPDTDAWRAVVALARAGTPGVGAG